MFWRQPCHLNTFWVLRNRADCCLGNKDCSNVFKGFSQFEVKFPTANFIDSAGAKFLRLSEEKQFTMLFPDNSIYLFILHCPWEIMIFLHNTLQETQLCTVPLHKRVIMIMEETNLKVKMQKPSGINKQHIIWSYCSLKGSRIFIKNKQDNKQKNIQCSTYMETFFFSMFYV